ncbi:MAG: PD-(D/E)XK nuclease family protein, partial [Thermodesulfovibrionia bacterium]|nr:PD-(D/E)XK nuclease family protein [Thermodesulfovibrionia bacterium]
YIRDKDINLLKEEVEKLIFEERAAERAVRALEIIEAYQAELSEKNLVDTEGVLRDSIDLIKKHLAQYNGLRNTDYGFTLVIDGFFDPTPLELEIMTALIDTAGKVCALVEEHSGIYKYFRANNRGLTVKKLKGPALSKKPGYFKYPSIEDEVEGIAKNVKKLILEGLRPWDVTVSFPAFSKYLPMFRRTLKKYGIPLSIGEYNLSASRPFAALEDMISCVEEDYPRNNFLSFLTSPCFPGIPEIVKERAVSYSYAAGIVKGKESWLSLKDILLNSAKGQLTADDRKTICEFQERLERTVDLLEGIKKKKDLLSFIDAVESALESLGFFASPGLHGPDEQGRRLSDIISGQIAELRYFAGQRKSGEHGFQRPAFYLRYMLKDLKGADENRDGVRIMPFESAAGIKTKALFFGGVIEGDLPSMPDIDPILPERVKKELGLPYLDYYLDRQRRYFMRLLNVPLIDTFFSCPSADGDKVFLPSPFLDWEKSMSPAELKIYSEQEVLIREGAIKHTVSKAGIFDVKEISHGKKAPGMLRQRTKAMSKGFINVTDIDYYRRCPLRFYVERVLCLETITPPRFEVEARLWGNLAHRIMEHLFKNGDIDLDKLDEKVFQALEKSLKQFPIEDFWA